MSSFINTVDVIGDDALTDSIIDRSITEFASNQITKIGAYAFANCKALTTVDITQVNSLEGMAFQNCTALKALILRYSTSNVNAQSNSFNGSTIATGTGYVYVPYALMDKYKAHSNWKNYAGRLRVLEDYTVDGTIDGQLDWNKINGEAE